MATGKENISRARAWEGSGECRRMEGGLDFLSCLLSLECTPWEGIFWRMLKQAYTVPCRASHPRGQGAQILCT